jgi:ERCC4-related helicase
VAAEAAETVGAAIAAAETVAEIVNQPQKHFRGVGLTRTPASQVKIIGFIQFLNNLKIQEISS